MSILLDLFSTLDFFKLNPEESKPTKQEQEIINYHTNTVKQGKQLINKDGSVTTVYSTGIKTPDGKFVSVPGYNRDSGKIMNEEEAYNFWKKDIEAGKFPVYNSGEELNKRSKELHKFMEAPDMTPDLDLIPDELNEMDIYTNFIKDKEGKKLTAYKPQDKEKYYTIGYGHYGEDVTEGMTITDEQAENYLKEDINKRLVAIKKAIPLFDSMPIEVRKHLLGSWFRGSLSGSPKTLRLINEGKFKEASKEFLNNNEYKTTKLTGVKDRMDATAKAIASLSL